MAKLELTLDQAIALAREVVQEYGEDYVYEDHHNMNLIVSEATRDEYHGTACRYEFQGQSCCLVGKILAKVGLSADDLKAMDRAENTRISHNRAAAELVAMDFKAVNFLQTLQDVQDYAGSWGLALERAEEGICVE